MSGAALYGGAQCTKEGRCTRRVLYMDQYCTQLNAAPHKTRRELINKERFAAGFRGLKVLELSAAVEKVGRREGLRSKDSVAVGAASGRKVVIYIKM